MQQSSSSTTKPVQGILKKTSKKFKIPVSFNMIATQFYYNPENEIDREQINDPYKLPLRALKGKSVDLEIADVDFAEIKKKLVNIDVLKQLIDQQFPNKNDEEKLELTQEALNYISHTYLLEHLLPLIKNAIRKNNSEIFKEKKTHQNFHTEKANNMLNQAFNYFLKKYLLDDKEIENNADKKISFIFNDDLINQFLLYLSDEAITTYTKNKFNRFLQKREKKIYTLADIISYIDQGQQNSSSYKNDYFFREFLHEEAKKYYHENINSIFDHPISEEFLGKIINRSVIEPTYDIYELENPIAAINNLKSFLLEYNIKLFEDTSFFELVRGKIVSDYLVKNPESNINPFRLTDETSPQRYEYAAKYLVNNFEIIDQLITTGNLKESLKLKLQRMQKIKSIINSQWINNQVEIKKSNLLSLENWQKQSSNFLLRNLGLYQYKRSPEMRGIDQAITSYEQADTSFKKEEALTTLMKSINQWQNNRANKSRRGKKVEKLFNQVLAKTNENINEKKAVENTKLAKKTDSERWNTFIDQWENSNTNIPSSSLKK